MKRFLLLLVGIVLGLIAVIVLAVRLSPWPSVAVISYMFSKGDQSSETALEKHVPPGIVTKRGIPYGEGKDEVFDINFPSGTDRPLPTIVWIHGGGWIGGSKEGIANYLKVLSGHGYSTVGVEYSTGFGSTYPKPVEQVNRALGYLQQHAVELNVDPDAMVLAGDSAGAQIAAQIAIITTDPGYAERIGIRPALPPARLPAVLLLSGAYDITSVDYKGDYAWFLKTVLWAYSGTKDFLDDKRFALASVTRYVTGTFPRAFISSGNGDPLAPQAVLLAQRLQGLGVQVDSLFFQADYSPPLPHEYQFNLDIPAGQEALTRMLAFIGSATARTK